MLKTNLDLGNGTILKDVRVWEVADGMPECRQGLLSDVEIAVKASEWWNSDRVGGSALDFLDSDGDGSWAFFIPLTEIVDAAIRMGKASGYVAGYNVFCNYEGGGGPFLDQDYLERAAEEYAKETS